MTKISLYNIDDNITANDKWIGSDVDTQNRTKNFTPKKLANYFNENQVINIGTSIQYKYYTLDPLESRPVGTLTFETEIGATVPFSTVTTFLLSKYTTKQNDVSQFLPLLVGTRSLLYKSSDINSFGLYTIDSIEPYITDPNFWVVTLTYMTGNGSLEEDKDYMISLVDFSDGDIPTKTSDLINDGEDGIHPFITAGDVVVPTLDSVLTEGNVSIQDAYLGRVHLFNTHLLSGYSSIGGEKDRVNFYNTASTPLGYFGLNSIMLKYGAYEGIIHSDYLTASRDYYLPNQSGTIALTSDIPTKTSDLINDGEDGIHPFITLEDIPPSPVPTLQSVTDEDNITTNSIFINELNLYDGSNDQYANIKAGEESFIFTSTATWNASFQFDFSNITGLPFKTYNLPFSDGTLALTSDIPTLTSELTNDGADGVNPFITLADVPVPTNGLPAGGTAGQILTKVDATDYNATWQENFADWTSVVKHTVKNNGLSGTITKGTAVYVTGSNGTNMLVGRASNASESTSSKTMGLMQSDITTTGGTQTGFVVTEGLLAGLNTAGQTAGDPVWLGVNGALIYGLINKPYAPAHLVFIGIVTKISAGNGEIFVNVQNGFELNEIHDVDLKTTIPVNGDILGFDGTLWVNKTIAGWLGYTPANASGTINYLPKFTGTSALGNSLISESTNLININSASVLLDNNRFLRGKFVDGTVKDIIGINDGNEIVSANVGAFHFTNIANVYIDGTAVPTLNLSNSAGALGQLILESGATGNINIRGNGGTRLITLSQNGQMAVSKGTVSLLAQQTIYPYATTIKGQVIKGFTGQTANLQEWQDSIGTVLAAVTAAGNVGIGTAAPVTSFEVVKSSTFSGQLGSLMLRSDATSTKKMYFGFDDTKNYGYLQSVNTGVAFLTTAINPNGGITLIGSSTANGTANLQAYTSTDGIITTFGRVGGTKNSQLSFYGYETGEVQLRYTGSSGDQYLTFFSNGAEKMRITNAGNVGIGTTAPAEKLHVSGASTVFQSIFESSNGAISGYFGGIQLGNNASSQNAKLLFSSAGDNILTIRTSYSSGTTNKITFEPGGTEVLRLQQNGNVGIGTTAPAYKLDVNGTVKVGHLLQMIEAPSTYGAKTIVALRDGSPDPASIYFYGLTFANSSGGFDISSAYSLNLSYTQSFAVQSKVWGGTSYAITNRLYINSSGNVGIGTNTPATLLDVNGVGTFMAYSTPTLLTKISGSYGQVITMARNGAGNNVGLGVAASGQLSFYTNNVETIRIHSNGNLLIGTTADIASSKLTVESTTQGFLPPRMTNAQRIAIATPAVGLCVYCTDVVEGLYINKSTGWTYIG